ncbi:MAG: hypothetical protein Q7T21_14890 [Gallionella sp.]|nr:hypothetical protein [Gallionella sp.]
MLSPVRAFKASEIAIFAIACISGGFYVKPRIYSTVAFAKRTRSFPTPTKHHATELTFRAREEEGDVSAPKLFVVGVKTLTVILARCSGHHRERDELRARKGRRQEGRILKFFGFAFVA